MLYCVQGCENGAKPLILMDWSYLEKNHKRVMDETNRPLLVRQTELASLLDKLSNLVANMWL